MKVVKVEESFTPYKVVLEVENKQEEAVLSAMIVAMSNSEEFQSLVESEVGLIGEVEANKIIDALNYEVVREIDL